MSKIGKNTIIDNSAIIGKNVTIGNNVTIYEDVEIGDNTFIWDNAVIGRVPMGVSSLYRKIKGSYSNTVIGEYSVIGVSAVIYAGTNIGNECLIGDNTVIREECLLNNNSVIGPLVSLQNNVQVGSHTRILQQSVISSYSRIGTHNFISLGFLTVSDKKFGREGYSNDKIIGPEIGNYNSIGPDVTVLDNIKIGSNNIIGAKSLVTSNIENDSVFYGSPCKFIKKNKSK